MRCNTSLSLFFLLGVSYCTQSRVAGERKKRGFEKIDGGAKYRPKYLLSIDDIDIWIYPPAHKFDGRVDGSHVGTFCVTLRHQNYAVTGDTTMSEELVKGMKRVSESISPMKPEELPGGARSFLLVDDQENLQVKLANTN